MLWGEIKNSALANLDLTEDEATEQRLIGNFYLWANEVITQISSTIKPKRVMQDVVVYTEYDRWYELSRKYNVYTDKIPDESLKPGATDDEKSYWTAWDETVFVNSLYKMPDKDFISFGNDIPIVKRTFNYHGHIIKEEKEAHDEDFIYRGFRTILFKLPGEYSIPYNARWFTFESTMADEDDAYEIDVPRDILECIPPYIAMKGFKIDDEYKSAVFKNEYEMALARIDDEHFEQNRTFEIGGDW